MAMKCPVCGGTMEKQYGFSGDLYQSNGARYVCMQCRYGSSSDDDILVDAVRKIQKEMEEKTDG